MRALGVGVIGVNARGGWAAEAHLPAVAAVDGLELVGVAAGSPGSADEVARQFHVPLAVVGGGRLIEHPDVDLVTVAAPVPQHRDLILAALAAGKHVLTEWPVGPETVDAVEVARAAGASTARAFVDLQARRNPAVVRLQAMLAAEAIGRVLGVTVHSSTAGWGPAVPESAAALEDPATGMNLLTIQTAHTLDLVEQVLGRFTALSALTSVQYPEVRIGDSGTVRHRTVADHVLVDARTADAWAAVQVAGGRPVHDTPFRLEVTGTDGTLVLRGGTPRGFQAGRLHLEHDGERVEVTDRATDGLPDPVVNVAGVYAAVRDDITTGSVVAASPADGVSLARLVDAVAESAAHGRTVTLEH
ncbi:Gfo/Idh/MocA family protein [Jatrophihabitans sp. YIM 134969]